MPYYADCYVLIESREKKHALKLIEQFLPGDPVESASIYEVPRFGAPIELEFTNANEFMEYLEANPSVDHAIYFSSSFIQNYDQVSIHYTKDGNMILCSSIPSDEELEYIRLEELKKLYNTPWGYIAYETPPENTSSDFIASVNSFNTSNDNNFEPTSESILQKIKNRLRF